MFSMVSARRTMNISLENYNSSYGRKSSKKKYLLFFFIPIFVFAIILLTNAELARSLKVTLNEWEVRYDTFSISFSETLSSDVKNSFESELSKIELDGKKRFSFVEEDGDILMGLSDKEYAVFTNYLIPVGHFYWLENSIEIEDIEDREIVVEEGNAIFVEAILERYLDLELEVKEKEDVLSYLKENEDSAISFLTLEDLDHTYQVLYFEDKYFLDDLEGGIEFHIGVDQNFAPDFLVDVIKTNTQELYGDLNLDEILKVNMSGVTALTRNLAFKIEESGDPAYPAEYISDFLGDADLVHTSNEVSFVPGCKPERSMSFCSHPDYIETLEAINANIIELTGNHNNDYGAEYNTQTIEMYKERGWGYYGGGLNTEDAQKPHVEDLKESQVAFIGYNYYDSIYNNHANLAGTDRAGANSYSLEKMEKDIKEMKEEGAFTIVTFQFQECWSYPPQDVIFPPCYKPLSNPDQREVFRAAIDFGADIVIGSQAHQPQTYEIYEGKPIFYGTGNIFFDQTPWIGTRQGIILTHYIHENKLLQSRITTTLYDDDMRPYVTDGEDRELLLQLLRDARD